MKKKQLEAARRNFNTGINAEQLKATISKDIAPVRDAYDIAYQALQKIEQLVQTIDPHDAESKPVRQMRELAAAMRDAAGVLVQMRDEGRNTVRFAAERQGTADRGSAPSAAPSTSVPQALPPKSEP